MKITVPPLLVLLSASAALARPAGDPPPPPPECSGTKNVENAWERGYRKGRAQFDDAFGVQRCETVSIGVQAVLRSLKQPYLHGNDAHDHKICAIRGFTQAVYDGFAETERRCYGVCIADGTFQGELAGTLYCGLSIELHGLPPALELPPPSLTPCGSRYEAACDEEFADTTEHFDQCGPYLQGGFAPVAQSTREEQCAFPDEDE